MSMDLSRRSGGAAGVLLMVACIAMALLAGLFFAYDLSIMPGLSRLDDAAYLTAMRNFNDEIDNSGPFAVVFLGALVATVWAAVAEYRRARRGAALWAAAAGVLYLAVLVITVSVNLPLNGELADLGDPAKAADLSLVDKFKGVWSTTNIMRTVLTTAAVGCLAQALKLHGRSTPAAVRQG
ncbi:anthrone oxygenase family protein [Streptomyces sp. NPDC054834]